MSDSKPLVYVAGPITGDPFGCVRQSVQAFGWLREFGCVPFLPQWSVIAEMVSGHPYETWMAYDFDMIRRCDGLVRLFGTSPGADREVELAHSLGLPVLLLSEADRVVPSEVTDWLAAITDRVPT